MADVDKLVLNGTIYNLSDSNSRSGLNCLRSDLNEFVDINILNCGDISDSSQRYASGITYTVNKNTGIVTANGTAVYDAWIRLYPLGTVDTSDGGLYYLSGCPSGGSSDTYYLYTDNVSDVTFCKDTGDGAFINLESGQSLRVGFMIKAGNTVTSMSFKPQLSKLTANGEAIQSLIDLRQSDSPFQCWNNKKQVLNRYYTLGSHGEMVVNTALGYIINTMFCPEGKIYYKRLSGAFTIVVDLITKTAVTLQNGYGKSEYIHDGSITVANPVMLFATSNDYRQPLVTNSPVFPSEYVYGTYFQRKPIIIGQNGDFTSLKDGIAYAVQFEDSVVKVLEGTYDLITEFGNQYFESLDSSSSELSGIQIGNGIIINFSPKAKVVCHYTGSNQYAQSKFSPFNMIPGSKGFTIIGLNLECSNVRYAVHDECNGNATYYKNQYIDCKISKDNSETQNWKNPLVIGGGLGQNGHIDIIRCYFMANAIPSIGSGKSVNYHNASASGSKSLLYVSDSYFDGIYTCGVSYYGSSIEITEMQITGCSMPAEPYINREGSATIENVFIRKFNNEIRQ